MLCAEGILVDEGVGPGEVGDGGGVQLTICIKGRVPLDFVLRSLQCWVSVTFGADPDPLTKGSGSAPDPDPTPDPTPFFSDHRQITFSLKSLILC